MNLMKSETDATSNSGNGEAAGNAFTTGSRLELAVGYEGLRLPAAVLLDNVRSMYNVGAFFRAADGVNLEKLWLCGITAYPPKKAISKTALGAEEVVAWEHDWDAIHMAEKVRGNGFELAAIETSPNAIDLFEWQPSFPCAWLSVMRSMDYGRNFWPSPTPTCTSPCWVRRHLLTSQPQQGS